MEVADSVRATTGPMVEPPQPISMTGFQGQQL